LRREDAWHYDLMLLEYNHSTLNTRGDPFQEYVYTPTSLRLDDSIYNVSDGNYLLVLERSSNNLQTHGLGREQFRVVYRCVSIVLTRGVFDHVTYTYRTSLYQRRSQLAYSSSLLDQSPPRS
jgi:hypothetical protein